MSEEEDFFRSVERIGKDNETGAVELTLNAARILERAGSIIKEKSELTRLLELLLAQKPAMAPMVNLVNSALIGLDEGVPLQEVCQKFTMDIGSSSRIVSNKASSLIKNGFRIMTYSNSSTVIETFRKAVSEGKRFEVVISEARPVREGILMAESLRNMGVPVKLVADSALFQEMEGINMVMVGADALSHKYLVNKIGTRGLAAQARLLGKDLVAIAGSEKVLPSGIDNYMKVLRPPDEIAEPVEGIEIVNYYFDQTPLHLVSRIVTEKGPMGPFEIIREAKEKKVHPIVADFFSRPRE